MTTAKEETSCGSYCCQAVPASPSSQFGYIVPEAGGRNPIINRELGWISLIAVFVRFTAIRAASNGDERAGSFSKIIRPLHKYFLDGFDDRPAFFGLPFHFIPFGILPKRIPLTIPFSPVRKFHHIIKLGLSFLIDPKIAYLHPKPSKNTEGMLGETLLNRFHSSRKHRVNPEFVKHIRPSPLSVKLTLPVKAAL
jgi:hypothetical protein